MEEAMSQSTNATYGRSRVARTRGALSGLLLVILGAWAALVPFIGPYFDFAFTPSPNNAWTWTAERGYMEVAPGVATVIGGLMLLFSASRVTTVIGAWLGVAGGTWLIIGPPLADYLDVNVGQPDPTSNLAVRTLEFLFFFSAIGAAILFVASVALGRMSTYSLRDVRAAERRASRLGAVQDDQTAAAPVVAHDSEPAVDERGGAVDSGWTEPHRVESEHRQLESQDPVRTREADARDTADR
jgi:hypothetical protein